MYLKSLTLKGFKSFADRTVMRFEPNLAAVVGPNGSGKSNISDAVLWVLGERNAKNLRGQYMEDVIFAGSSARKAVSVAEVELCLDNSDGTLPVDYAEVSIGRRMYRSGESEYLINGSVVRRMDVLDILHDSGLGTGTNSIISQGNLDSVLSSRPEDRRALIEEAAGILKHKERKARSERKLARMDVNLSRVGDIVGEVERQLGPLKRKAKRALTHAELSAQLADVSLSLAVDDLRLLQGRWDDAKRREAELTEQSQELERAIAGAQERLDALQEQLKQRTLAEGGTSAAQRRAQAMSERFNSALLLLAEKKRRAAQDLEQTTRSLETTLLSQKDLQDDFDQARERLATSQRDKAALDARLARLEEDHAARKKERKGLYREIDASTAEQRALTHRIETIQATQEALRENLSEQRARAQVIAAQIQDCTARLDAAREQAVAERATADGLAEELERLRSDEKAARDALNETAVAREQARRTLDQARDAATQASAERSALEELERAEEAANGVLSWLLSDEHPCGDLVPLTHQLTVADEWEHAVEVFLAGDLRSLLVGDGQALADVAHAVSSGQQIGSAVLLEAGERASAQGPDQISGCPRLLDSVKIGAHWCGVLDSLMDGVYLADTLDDALALAQQHPAYAFLTRDGSVCGPRGRASIVGKADPDGAQSALARRRALEELRVRESQTDAAFTRASEALGALEEALRTHQAESLRLSQSFAQTKGRSDAAQEAASRSETARAALEQDLERLRHDREANEQALAQSRPQSESLADELAECQAKLAHEKSRLDELQQTLSPIQQKLVELSRELSDARLDKARLDERVAYDQRMVSTRQREIDAARRSTEDARALIARARLASSRIDPLVDVLSSLSDSAKLVVVRLDETLSAESAHSRELAESIEALTQESRQMRQRYDERATARAEVRVEKGRLEVQVDAAIRAITEECGTPLESAMESPALEDRAQAQELHDSLERRIKSMGAINPDAAREFEEVSERHAYLNAQLEDMKRARSSLTKIVAVIDERMKTDFLDTFDEVNANFQEIFATLFPGGKAYLTLEDPDDPENTGVEVNAHPIGKRVRKMSLLSGGEKSMTALALLFAVYRIRKTPFYILDEVEAALDDTNLRRLLAYLDTIRHDTQFIMITHQRRTMEQADILYGVSMQADGVTKVLSQKLDAAIKSQAKED